MLDFQRGRWSGKTQEAYAGNWREFERYCAEHGVSAIPADAAVIAEYLLDAGSRVAVASVQQRLASIVAAHQLGGHTVNVKSTEIRDAWAKVRREGAPKKPKAALTAEDIKRIMGGVPKDRRVDRALLLLGFATLLRRSELSALNYDDLDFRAKDSLTIMVRRSKADKFGKGESVAALRTGTEYCPVAALEAYLAWQKLGGIKDGAVFRNEHRERMTPQVMAGILKRWAKNAGYDPREIGMHSLRRGGITTMFRNGAKLEDVMKVSRHVTPSITLGYVEAHQAQKNPAIRALGL